jgi:hypothetical protein
LNLREYITATVKLIKKRNADFRRTILLEGAYCITFYVFCQYILIKDNLMKQKGDGLGSLGDVTIWTDRVLQGITVCHSGRT